MPPRHRSTATLLALVLTGCSGSAAIPGLDEPVGSATGTSARSDGGNASASGDGEAAPGGAGSSAAATPLSVTIAAVGEVAADAAVVEVARAPAGQFDFTPLLDAVRPYARGADVALCHLESPVSATAAGANPARVYPPEFTAPRELAQDLVWAGFTGCSAASEHTMDAGPNGLRGTISAFRGTGLGYSGPGTSESNPIRVATYRAGAARVAHLSYTYSVLPSDARPNQQTPPKAAWLSRSLWPDVSAEGIIADAERAKQAGADFVAVSLHWGDLFSANPTQDEVDLADTLLRSPAVDVIFGAHSHRVQPCRRINGKFVFLGLGDFLTGQSGSSDPRAGQAVRAGVFVQVTLRRDGSGRVDATATYLPTQIDPRTFVVTAAGSQDHPATFKRVAQTLRLLGDCPIASAS